MHLNVTIFAGTGAFGIADGVVTSATFSNPDAVTVSPTGIVYVTEGTTNGIRKIENGFVTTLADRKEGYADGPLDTTALFNQPGGIVCDRAGNLYVADTMNHRIRKIDFVSNEVTTVAGPGKQSGAGEIEPSSSPDQGWADGFQIGSLFNYPSGVTIDASQTNLYISETHRIRRVPIAPLPTTNYIDMVSTVAAVGIMGFSDGPAVFAQFNQPYDNAVTQTGDLFVADSGNYRIRRVSPSGSVTTVAGDGVPATPSDKSEFEDNRPAQKARFELAYGLAIDDEGNVWVADGSYVRIYSPVADTVSTARRASDGEPIQFITATGIAIYKKQIFVTDLGANRIVLLTPT